jgi:hypothetical protein
VASVEFKPVQPVQLFTERDRFVWARWLPQSLPTSLPTVLPTVRRLFATLIASLVLASCDPVQQSTAELGDSHVDISQEVAAGVGKQAGSGNTQLESSSAARVTAVVGEATGQATGLVAVQAGAWTEDELVYLGQKQWSATATKTPFAVRYAGELSRYNSNFATVMPGETLEIEAADRSGSGRFVLRTFGGEVEAIGLRRWTWRAPQRAGAEIHLVVRDLGSGASLRIVVFVLMPADRMVNGVLNGYKIGRYATEFPWETTEYDPPRGFIELTEERVDTEISPTFRLGEFVCKQDADYPKYVYLQPRLLHKLEFLRERFLERGYPADKIRVMSGYRTPAYNRNLGSARFSRHMYGSAADIYLDAKSPRGWLDDLNGDGRINSSDIRLLYNIVEDWTEAPGYAERFIGGLARYRSNRSHGPFLHVDLRSIRARW